MTSLNHHSMFPGSATDGRPESLDMESLDMKCVMRKSENIFYIYSHQEMPATKKTLDNIDPDIRKYFGFGKRLVKDNSKT